VFEKTKEQIFAECAALGESNVRVKLNRITDTFSYNERSAAEEWLRLREDELNNSRISSAERRAARAEIIAAISAIAAIIAAIAAIVAIYAKP
jgi:hypothetical protein